jgi:hypothetical protein
MKDKICMNCIYGKQIDQTVFECRRNAPQRTHGIGTGENNQLFPNVQYDDWCGEFIPYGMGYERYGIIESESE